MEGIYLLSLTGRLGFFFITGNLVLIFLYATDMSDPVAVGNLVMQNTEAVVG